MTKCTHLWVHAAHSARLAQAGLSSRIVDATLLWVRQDFVAKDDTLGYALATEHRNVRVCDFLEQLGIATLVWV